MIETWTGRGIGDCITFLFLFAFVVPFLVRARCCLRLSQRGRSLHRSLINMTGALAVVVPNVGAWLSLGLPYLPILL